MLWRASLTSRMLNSKSFSDFHLVGRTKQPKYETHHSTAALGYCHNIPAVAPPSTAKQAAEKIVLSMSELTNARENWVSPPRRSKTLGKHLRNFVSPYTKTTALVRESLDYCTTARISPRKKKHLVCRKTRMQR